MSAAVSSAAPPTHAMNALRLHYEAELDSMTKQLIEAKKLDQQLLVANQRIVELEASLKSTSKRLSAVMDADAFQQEQVRVLREQLEAERLKSEAERGAGARVLEAERRKSEALEAEAQQARHETQQAHNELADYKLKIAAEKRRDEEHLAAQALAAADGQKMLKAQKAAKALRSQDLCWGFLRLVENWEEANYQKKVLQYLDLVGRRLKNVSSTWAFTQWKGQAEELRFFKDKSESSLRKMMNECLTWGFVGWKSAFSDAFERLALERKLNYLMRKLAYTHMRDTLAIWEAGAAVEKKHKRAAEPLRFIEMKGAFKLWREIIQTVMQATSTIAVMARRRRHTRLSAALWRWGVRARYQVLLACWNADLHSAVKELTAPRLEASISELRELEARRGEERASRAQKHAQQVTELKRVNARILHEFAEAEQDFRRHEREWQDYERRWLDAEQRWRRAGVLDRVLEAVFGTTADVEQAWPHLQQQPQQKQQKQQQRRPEKRLRKRRQQQQQQQQQPPPPPPPPPPQMAEWPRAATVSVAFGARPQERAPLRLPSPYKDEWPTMPSPYKDEWPSKDEGPTGHTSAVIGLDGFLERSGSRYYEEEDAELIFRHEFGPSQRPLPAPAAAHEGGNRLRARRSPPPRQTLSPPRQTSPTVRAHANKSMAESVAGHVAGPLAPVETDGAVASSWAQPRYYELTVSPHRSELKVSTHSRP
jgi:hypothetical protein